MSLLTSLVILLPCPRCSSEDLGIVQCRRRTARGTTTPQATCGGRAAAAAAAGEGSAVDLSTKRRRRARFILSEHVQKTFLGFLISRVTKVTKISNPGL